MNSLLFEIIEKRLLKLNPYIHKNNIEAFRLYNQNLDDFPYRIDILKTNALIHLFGGISDNDAQDLEKFIKSVFPIENFFYKNRTNREINMPELAAKNKETVVCEYGHYFRLNLSDYIDTGLFLDHRETRKWVGVQSQGKIVLNTFAYTGSFSIYAAKAGATKTYSVDLSKTYCQWIKNNFELNNISLENNWIYKMDTAEFLRYARRKNLFFDIIILDPPTFSKNKNKSFSVKNNHPQLINEALDLLLPSGFILFSSNYSDFRLATNKIKPCRIEEKNNTIPPDFEGSQPHRCFIIKK